MEPSIKESPFKRGPLNSSSYLELILAHHSILIAINFFEKLNQRFLHFRLTGIRILFSLTLFIIGVLQKSSERSNELKAAFVQIDLRGNYAHTD